MLKKSEKISSSRNLEIAKYIDSNSKMTLEKDGKNIFVKLSKEIAKSEVRGLLEELWENKFEIAFYDAIYPIASESGAYFSYSTNTALSKEDWGMTFGNQGWSGGIYHIKKETVNQQIYNLVKKGKLNKIRMTEVRFFSHYERESKDKSEEKDKEIYSVHA